MGCVGRAGNKVSQPALQWGVVRMKHARALSLLGLMWVAVVAAANVAQVGLPTFTDVTEQSGIHFKHSYGDYEMSNIVEAAGYGACFFDYNGDGFQDIYFPTGAGERTSTTIAAATCAISSPTRFIGTTATGRSPM